MNSFAVAIFAVALAVANAGLIPHSVVAHGTTLQGPSTKTVLAGPDGSHIVASAPGGVISTAVDAGYVAHSAVVAPVAPAVVAHATPAVVAPVARVVAPVVAPAVLAHTAPVAPAGIAPVVAHATPIDPAFVAHGPHGALIAPGTGIEGQYQHDYTETLYDDGSYKGEFYREHH